jgi:hypothetical protein
LHYRHVHRRIPERLAGRAVPGRWLGQSTY